jgi:GNAT superfamily N-acetyltransferase
VSLRVEAVDAAAASDETLRAIYRIEDACDPGRWDDEQHAAGYMRHPPGGQLRLHWLAFEGGDPVGMARLSVDDDSTLAWLHLGVAPDRRRRGAGSALFRAARQAAHGRAIGGHHASTDGAAFARALGACGEQRDVRSELDLRGVTLPEPGLPPGYELRSWSGAAPDELVASFATARNAIDDAPQPDGQTLATWSVARLREYEHAIARRGREVRVAVVLAGDEVVAFTELRVGPAPARTASTEDTATVADHRGRGLCRAVKLESLRLLRADHPGVETVSTLNAENNGPMRAINTKLGFVPVVTLTTAVLRPH